MTELNDVQIIEIARLCHAANMELQIVQGDPNPSKPWDDTPDEIRQSAIEGVRKALAGATSEELHDSWCEFKIGQGWTWGPVKDAEKKQHPSLVGYPSLPLSEKLKDFIFNGIVEGYAAAHGLGAKGLAAKHPIGESSEGVASDLEEKIIQEAEASERKFRFGSKEPRVYTGGLRLDHVGTLDLLEELDRRNLNYNTAVRPVVTLEDFQLANIIEFVQNRGYVVQEQADYDAMVDVKEITHYNAPVTHNYYSNQPTLLEGVLDEIEEAHQLTWASAKEFEKFLGGVTHHVRTRGDEYLLTFDQVRKISEAAQK